MGRTRKSETKNGTLSPGGSPQKINRPKTRLTRPKEIHFTSAKKKKGEKLETRPARGLKTKRQAMHQR